MVLELLEQLYNNYKPDIIQHTDRKGKHTRLRSKRTNLTPGASVLGALIDTTQPADVTAKATILQEIYKLDKTFSSFDPETETCSTLTPSNIVTTVGKVKVLGAALGGGFDGAAAAAYKTQFEDETERFTNLASTGQLTIPFTLPSGGSYISFVNSVPANATTGSDPVRVLVHTIVENQPLDFIDCPTDLDDCKPIDDISVDSSCDELDDPCSIDHFKPATDFC